MESLNGCKLPVSCMTLESCSTSLDQSAVFFSADLDVLLNEFLVIRGQWDVVGVGV